MANLKDLTGMRFGHLTVQNRCEDYVSPKGKHIVQWLCKCDCGNLIKANTRNLRRPTTYGCKSCFDKHKVELYTLINKVEFVDDIAYVYTNKGEQIIIDAEDYDKIKHLCWGLTNLNYVYATEHLTHKNVQIHRVIMDILDKPDIIVDHKNGNPLDNRKSNLRLCTKAQNSYNKRMQPYNTSGVTGVTWDKRTNKWKASIGYKGKTLHLGTFDSKQDAINARKQGEDKYFGEFSYNNSRNSK